MMVWLETDFEEEYFLKDFFVTMNLHGHIYDLLSQITNTKQAVWRSCQQVGLLPLAGKAQKNIKGDVSISEA